MKRVHSIVGTTYAHEQGIFGQGIGVAVLDTGIIKHPDFGNRIRVFRDFLYKRNRIYDDCGHGTHISGIIAGNGEASYRTYIGMAPEADVIMLKVLDSGGNGTVANVMAGLHWVLMNKEQYNIRVVNISVGTVAKEDGDEESQLVCAVNEVWDAGLVVCVAAGNNGPNPSTITTPGISRKVITSLRNGMLIIHSGELVTKDGKFPNRATLWHELSWSHYRLLMKLEDNSRREFYGRECVESAWSVRQLERQINSFFYERLLATQKSGVESVKNEIHSLEPKRSPDYILKDPYILEFLDLKENHDYHESDLEQALT